MQPRKTRTTRISLPEIQLTFVFVVVDLRLFQFLQKTLVVNGFDQAAIDHRGGVVFQNLGSGAAHFIQDRLHAFYT